MKCMILAAGKGERMRPLTEHTPKPLLKVGDLTLIEHNILRLEAAGIKELVINVGYRGEQIKQHLDNGQRYGLRIVYSEEPAEPLGPGGGIVNALPLLGTQHFLLMAADLWSHFPIASLLDKVDHLAHMVLTENPDFHQQGDYGISDGRLTHEGTKYTYAGYSVWHPALFNDYMPGTRVSLTPFIDKAISLKAITAEKYSGDWYNIGTPEQLAALSHPLSTHR